jgi:hypothetical protein
MQIGRHIGIIILGLSFTFSAQTQSFLEISTGPGYQSQQFIRLKDDAKVSVKLTEWDIAFTSFGQQDAGVHFNEASGSSMGQSLPEMEVYDTKSTDFAKLFVVDSIKANRLYNDEKSWSYGAFNSTRVASSPFDFGWGKYAPATNSVVGEKVFVIKLKNGTFKKFMIVSYGAAGYTFKYADLDGSNEVTKVLQKTPGAQNLLFFSFAKNDVVSVAMSGGYDLIYTRYTSLAQDPNSPLVAQYNVTGVLSGPAALTARIESQSPESELPTGTTNYTKQADVIGYDWKSFNNTWSINEKLVFFLKSPVDQHIYKLRFIDFEGASTGNATIEKTDLGTVSSTDNELSVALGIYPNPAQDDINVIIDAATVHGQGTMSIIDVNGKLMSAQNINIMSGLNAYSQNVSQLSSGIFTIQIVGQNGLMVNKKFVKI